MSMYMPGATAVGITFDKGVVFASEKRIAYGGTITDERNINLYRIFKTTYSLSDNFSINYKIDIKSNVLKRIENSL